MDRDGRPCDVFGRPELHSPFLALLRAVPGLRDQFKRVPETFGAYELDGPYCALVKCPCGEAGDARLKLAAGHPETCEGCGRCYVFTGQALFAARGMTDEEWRAFQAEPLEAA